MASSTTRTWASACEPVCCVAQSPAVFGWAFSFGVGSIEAVGGNTVMTPTTTPPSTIFPELAGTRRFTVDKYHRLIDAGILDPQDKVELLDGYVLIKRDYPELTPTDGPFPDWRWLRRWSSAEYHRMID